MQSDPEPFRAEASWEGGRCVLALGGELDLSVVPQFEALAAQALADDPVLLIIDLSDLTFIDSSGIRSVLAVREQADDARQGFGMIAGPDNVQKLFEISGISSELPWLSDRGSPEP